MSGPSFFSPEGKADRLARGRARRRAAAPSGLTAAVSVAQNPVATHAARAPGRRTIYSPGLCAGGAGRVEGGVAAAAPPEPGAPAGQQAGERRAPQLVRVPLLPRRTRLDRASDPAPGAREVGWGELREWNVPDSSASLLCVEGEFVARACAQRPSEGQTHGCQRSASSWAREAQARALGATNRTALGAAAARGEEGRGLAERAVVLRGHAVPNLRRTAGVQSHRRQQQQQHRSWRSSSSRRWPRSPRPARALGLPAWW